MAAPGNATSSVYRVAVTNLSPRSASRQSLRLRNRTPFREALDVEGKPEYLLRPLGVPTRSQRLTAADAMASPAAQLFVERVSTVVDDFVLTDAEAPAVVEICRTLDGLPLAIELAAAQVEVLGISGLATNLKDNLRILTGRRRSAMPQYRTLRDVLEWNYGLLTENEKRF